MRTNCWWRLSGYVMRHRRDLLLGFGAALAGTVIAVLVPLVTKRVIDDAIAADHRPLAPWAVVLVAAAGATYLLTYVRRYYGGRIAHLVQHDLRMDAFQALLRWDGRQQDRWSSGQLIVRTTNDLQLVQALLFDVPNVLRHVLTLLLGVAVMTWLSVPLALLAVLLVPVIGLIAHRSRRLLAAATHCAQEHKAAVTGVVDAAVCGIRVVKAFGQEERETVKLVTASRALYAAQLRVARLNAHFGPLLQTLPALGQMAVFALGGWMAAQGSITVGTFVAFWACLTLLARPACDLAGMLTIAQQARAGAVRVLELIDSRPTLVDGTKPLSLGVRGQRLLALYYPFVALLCSLATTLVLLDGAREVRAGVISVGALVTYLLYIELLYTPIGELAQMFDDYQRAAVAAGRIRSLLSTRTPSSPAARPVGTLRGEVVFDAVHYSYRTREVPALAGINLRIPAGQTVVFVGSTGSGKSTLIKLVARFYDPTHGTVRVDGCDLREFDVDGYRNRLGIVTQEQYVFAGTVRDAIAYGRPDATDAQVERAAREVGAHPMITALDNGYLHQVTAGGRNLSAGQLQLLALARARLVDLDILLLDEATVALDPATEAVVQRATLTLAARRTTLIVAHGLAIAEHADRIVVLEHGTVVEDGAHTELLAAGGHYSRLWAAHTRLCSPEITQLQCIDA